MAILLETVEARPIASAVTSAMKLVTWPVIVISPSAQVSSVVSIITVLLLCSFVCGVLLGVTLFVLVSRVSSVDIPMVLFSR